MASLNKSRQVGPSNATYRLLAAGQGKSGQVWASLGKSRQLVPAILIYKQLVAGLGEYRQVGTSTPDLHAIASWARLVLASLGKCRPAILTYRLWVAGLAKFRLLAAMLGTSKQV